VTQLLQNFPPYVQPRSSFNQGLRADSVAPEFTSRSSVVAFTQTRRRVENLLIAVLSLFQSSYVDASSVFL